MIRFSLNCLRICHKYGKDEVTVYAAQASFFLVLAFFPFLMLLLTLIQFIPSVNKSDLQMILVQIMPDMLDALILSILDDLYLKSPGTMLSITALLALWSAARGMMGIERGLNRIYGSSQKRGYLMRRLICAGYTLLFMVVCAVSLVLLVFGRAIQNLFLRFSPAGNLHPSCNQFPRPAVHHSVFVCLCTALHHCSRKKTKPLAAAAWGCFCSHLLAAVFLWILFVFYPFQQLFLHVRKFGCRGVTYALAVLLHLYPFYRCRD